MRKSRCTEGQIAGVLKELKTCAKSTSACRKYGVRESTLYNWQSKGGGLEARDLAKLRQLEDEIAGSRGSSPTKSSTSKRSRLSSRETSKAPAAGVFDTLSG
jgi:putative transposase